MENDIEEIVEISQHLISTCLSFPSIEISHDDESDDAILEQYRQHLISQSKYQILNMELMKRDVIDEIKQNDTALISHKENKAKLKELTINNKIKCMDRLRERQSLILNDVLMPSSILTPKEDKIRELLRKRDRLVVRLQRLVSEYDTIVTTTKEYEDKNRELKLSCDALVTTLDEQETEIEQIENREEQSMREEQRHNLLSAERKYKRQKKENTILRNIYSSIVLASKIDWSRKERVRTLMLCNEDLPGVPEEELEV